MMIARTVKVALLGMMVLGLSETLFGDVQYTFTNIEYPLAQGPTEPSGINNSGQIVGEYFPSNIPHIGNGFLYSSGNFTGFAYPGAVYTSLLGINNSGQILGYAPGALDYFIYSGGTYTAVLNALPVPAQASGINDSDQIVGFGYPGIGNQPGTGFLYSNGTYTRINDPNSVGGTGARGINDSGQIVGSYTDSAGDGHGFLYSGGSYTTIDYPGASDTDLLAINNLGQIVGIYNDSTGDHSFLYSGGSFTPINVPGASGTDVSGINDSGQIVGFGAEVGFLATPAVVPEPCSFQVLAGCLLALVALAHRRKRNTSTP